MPTLEEVTRWWPCPEAKPRLSKGKDGRLRIAANGTRACSGAWRLSYRGAAPNAWYEVSVEVSYADLEHPREMLGAVAR